MSLPWKGLATDRMPVFIGYDRAERMISALLGRVEAWGPDAVVAIARGGLVPGTMVSCALALPLAVASYDRTAGIAAWIGPRPDGRRVLLVDDCSATGTTLAGVRDAILQDGYDCATMTIVYDPETTACIPNFSHPMREFFRFPWERGEATPAARARRSNGTPAERAYEKPFFGLDLDGIFLPDIPRAHYEADLDDALRRRHSLSPFPTLPPFATDRAVVITGRQDMDRAVTAEWLDRHGYGAIPLECRPAGVPADIVSVSRYKAETATRWGCTHYLESEAEQAVRIAALAPHLVVSWWSAEEIRGWTIGAAHTPAGP
ncbi:MAG: phosphoribosyltransferase family protein [Rhodospirillales bacterium]